MKKGEVYKIKLGTDGIGCEQRGDRYAVVIQNNTGNFYSNTTIVALITSKENKAKIPTHIDIDAENSGIIEPSVVMCEQVRTVDKQRLGNKIGKLSEIKMVELDKALAISLGMTSVKDNGKVA